MNQQEQIDSIIRSFTVSIIFMLLGIVNIIVVYKAGIFSVLMFSACSLLAIWNARICVRETLHLLLHVSEDEVS